MFFLYHHNDLDRLAELQAVLLQRRERAHALEPDTVIVPNRGVGRWLQMRLAGSEGIAANLQMPLLARFIWDHLPASLPGASDGVEYGRARMLWHIYAVLPAAAAEHPAIARYLAGQPPDLHRLQLAEKLADLFDQYLIYRPTLLRAWAQGRIAKTHPEAWQAVVWNHLRHRLGREDRAQLLDEFIRRLLDTRQDISSKALPGVIHCFGLGHLPPEYVRFLYALGQRIDVHFLLPNPCAVYWGDILRQRPTLGIEPSQELPESEMTLEAEHPLLASLGRGTRDLLRVLYADEMTGIQEPELGDALRYEAPAKSGLLARIQDDIIAMSARPSPAAASQDDASLQIHACHGPLREVQVLHDQLLDRLSADPALTPRDIVVMMPDVTAYAPAIESVFGAATGARHIPYSLSDRSRAGTHPAVQSFRQLLDLPLSRWEAPDILALAAVPAIGRQFGLDESVLQTLRDWVDQAGVRWGLDANTRARFNAGSFNQNSWQFGLDRLLLGFMQNDEGSLTAGVAPWTDLEGGATAGLGGLWLLLDRLRFWETELQHEASAEVWQDRLNSMTDTLFRPDHDDRAETAALDEIRACIASLEQAGGCLGDMPLSWVTVRELLSGQLAETASRQPFLGQGVTFCGLLPLRAVPFDVVCLLGMNDEAFPRPEKNRSLNLLRAAPQLGDHSPRDDDRLLFLQALTSAKACFYISYTGQDLSSGDSLPPAILVGELLDFVHQYYFADTSRAAFEKRLITRQPMHPFSPRLFYADASEPRVFSFAREWESAEAAGRTTRTAAPPFVDDSRTAPLAVETLDLIQLKRFFDHPGKTFLRDRLQIQLDTADKELESHEPLALDGLVSYQIRQALLRQASEQGNPAISEQPDALWLARGLLPPPPLHAAPFAEQAARVNRLLPIWHRWAAQGGPMEALDIDIKVDDIRLTGRIGDLWPDGIRRLRAGRMGMQYRLRAWIDYLVYRVAGYRGALLLAGLDDYDVTLFTGEIDSETAGIHLQTLLRLYREGMTRPLPFLPSLAEDYLKRLDRLDADKALAQVNAGLGNDFSPRWEMLDPYFGGLLDEDLLGGQAEHAEFVSLTQSICGPVAAILAPSQAPA